MDVGEVRAAVARASEDLPLLQLQDAADALEQQRSRLAHALTGSTNDDTAAALELFAAATAAIGRAIESHRAAQAQCEEYLAYA